jgi:hypothetical protein
LFSVISSKFLFFNYGKGLFEKSRSLLLIGRLLSTVPGTGGTSAGTLNGGRIPHTGVLILELTGGSSDSGNLGLSSGGSGGLLLLKLLLVRVDKHVNHNVPGGSARDRVTEAENLTSKEPVHQSDGVLTLVVARDDNVNTTEVGVSIAEGDNGAVNVGRLSQGLVVLGGVGNDQQTGLDVLGLDVVGEGTGGETSGNGVGSNILGELEDGTLGIRSTGGLNGTDGNVDGVLNGSNDTGSKDKLLPGLAEIDDVDTYHTKEGQVSEQKQKPKKNRNDQETD